MRTIHAVRKAHRLELFSDERVCRVLPNFSVRADKAHQTLLTRPLMIVGAKTLMPYGAGELG